MITNVREAPASKSGWSIRRRAGLAVCLVGGIGLALWVGFGGVGAEKWKAELRAKRERFTLEELDLAPPLTNEPVLSLLESLAPGADALGKGGGYNPAERDPERPSPVLWKQPCLESCHGVEVKWETAEAIADALSVQLEELHVALRDPPLSAGLGYDFSGAEASRRNSILAVAYGLHDFVLVELHRGSQGAAMTNLLTLVRCARYNRDGGLLLDQVIRMSIAELASNALWQVLQAPGWSERELHAVQEEWLRLDLLGPMPKVFEVERARALADFLTFRDEGLPYIRNFARCFGGPMPAVWKQHLYFSHWRTFRSGGVEREILRDFQVLLDRARSLAAGIPAHQLPPGTPIHRIVGLNAWMDRWVNPTGLTCALSCFVSGTLDTRVIETLMQREADRRLAIAAIAIERYRSERGRYPDNLSELTPEYLSEVPVSPFDGQPIRFRLSAGGRFRLAAPEHGTFELPPGRYDALWPTSDPETPESPDCPLCVEEILPAVMFEDAPLSDVVAVLARTAGMEVYRAPGVTYDGRPPVSLNLENVTARNVLEAVLNNNGLGLQHDGFTERYWVVQPP